MDEVTKWAAEQREHWQAVADEITTRRLGIPYARAVAGGVVCPACGATIKEPRDNHGENRTNFYAKHYEAKHS